MRIDIVEDDEQRQIFMLDGRIDIREHDLPEAEKVKWAYKLYHNLFTVIPVKDGSETLH